MTTWEEMSTSGRTRLIFNWLSSFSWLSTPGAALLASVCRFETACMPRHDDGLPVVILDNFTGDGADWRSLRLSAVVSGRKYVTEGLRLGVLSAKNGGIYRMKAIDPRSNALFEWVLANAPDEVRDWSVGPAGHYLGVPSHKERVEKYMGSVRTWYQYSRNMNAWNFIPLLAWEGQRWKDLPDLGDATTRNALLDHGGNAHAVDRLIKGGVVSNARALLALNGS